MTTLTGSLTMTAPSSPKPEEVDTTNDPAYPPGSVVPPPPVEPQIAEPDEDDDEEEEEDDTDLDDEEEEDDEDAEARGAAGWLQEAKEGYRDTETNAIVKAERDGYLNGLLIGVAIARLSPYVADRLVGELADLIAAAYGNDPMRILEGVDGDAQAVVEAALRDMESERRAS